MLIVMSLVTHLSPLLRLLQRRRIPNEVLCHDAHPEEVGHLDEETGALHGPSAGVQVVVVLAVDALGEEENRVPVLLQVEPEKYEALEKDCPTDCA